MDANQLNSFIIEHLDSGVIVVSLDGEVCLWNRFMENHLSLEREQVIGRSIYDVFPELCRDFFTQKLKSCVGLNSPSFTRWEQREHLFKMPHHRPLTTDQPQMLQNCTLLPIDVRSGQEQVCIMIEDATAVAYYQKTLSETLKQLEIASRTDGLTQVANRMYWEEVLAKECQRSRRYGTALSLILFDLDKFKRVNDAYGHQAGDAVLTQVTARVQSQLRAHDLLGRYGGEEFGILLPQTGVAEAQRVAERIRFEIQKTPICALDHEINVTVSLGVSEYLADCPGPDALVSIADKALYTAKGMGRNQVVIGDELLQSVV